jgi:hypothetical protein
MTRSFVPDDNTQTQNLGSLEKYWKNAYLKALVTKNPQTQGTVEILLKDIAKLGNLDELKSEIMETVDSLQGIVTYLDGYDFGTATPSQEALTNYALQQTGWDAVKNSTDVVNLFDGHEWIYNQETNAWIDFGQSVVSKATNSSLGIVKGNAATAGKVSVDSNGEMAVNGFGDKANTSAVTDALAAKANLDSPAFTGTPTAPTPATDANNTELATTAFVKAQGYSTGTPNLSAYAPKPTTAAGVGQVVYTSGQTLTAPAGGTWLCFAELGGISFKMGLYAGGAIVIYASFEGQNCYMGSWRIA